MFKCDLYGLVVFDRISAVLYNHHAHVRVRGAKCEPEAGYLAHCSLLST